MVSSADEAVQDCFQARVDLLRPCHPLADLRGEPVPVMSWCGLLVWPAAVRGGRGIVHGEQRGRLDRFAGRGVAEWLRYEGGVESPQVPRIIALAGLYRSPGGQADGGVQWAVQGVFEGVDRFLAGEGQCRIGV